MGACEIGAERQMFERVCVVVEHGADFIHVGDAVVILGAEGEALKGSKCGDADCIKMPSTETGVSDLRWIRRQLQGTLDQV